ncbi:MAG: TlpA family protein disulfide reductase [Actinomycetota bacterium]
MTEELWNRMLSRRAMLRAAGLGGLAALAAACTGGHVGPTPPPASLGTIRALLQGAKQLSLLTGLGDSEDDAIQTGKSFYIFDLSSGPTSLLQGGTPMVFVAKDENGRAGGPFPARWSLFTGYAKTGDTSPKTQIPGIYWAEIDIPSPGQWTVAAVAKSGTSRGVGVGHAVVADDVIAKVGSKALSVPTPVATTTAQLDKICTRRPPDHMHYISLDRALANGKPTVVSFATPLLCESQLCGPVVDEQILVFEKVGKQRANFIHVEEFPTQDVSKPSKPFVEWGFRTEPWVIVIDRTGTIRARFLGPATADMIETALDPLL